MKGKFGFRIIDGLRRSGRLSGGEAVYGSERCSEGTELLHQLVDDSADQALPLALKASEKRLNALLEDRTRIGRDLHDCVLQSLYAIGLSLETHRRTSPPLTLESHGPGDQTVDQLNKLIRDIRRMIRGLEEGTVQEFDLMAELNELARTYNQVGHVQIRLMIQPRALDVLTHEEERELLNITREALSNSVRHAQATHITVRLQNTRSRIRLTIADDGVGFSHGDVPSSGYGLANMAARAKKLGGALRVQSRKGRGTQVVAEFSLEPILTPA